MNGPNGQKRIARTPQTSCMFGGRFSLCEQTLRGPLGGTLLTAPLWQVA